AAARRSEEYTIFLRLAGWRHGEESIGSAVNENHQSLLHSSQTPPKRQGAPTRQDPGSDWYTHAATIRPPPRDFVNPVDYQHPYDSMNRFAKALALCYDANRTRHSYYRQLRLIHEHFACDPAQL